MRGWMIVIAVGAVGCSEVTTSANVAPGTALERYRTYGWMDGATSSPRSEAEQAVRAALQRELALRGIVPATDAAPDFMIAYHARRENRTERTEGTLVVELIDARTDRVFWRGTASSLVDHSSRPDLDRIDHAISRLLQDYPAPASAAAKRPAM